MLFDRSWYNRAGVERVMGFCTEEDVAEFFRSCPEFERMLVRSGIKVVKYWFSITDNEQHKRFLMRIRDPLKQWKLTPNDQASISKFAEYGKARDRMFRLSDTPVAPWTVINSNVKKLARLEAMRVVLHALPYRHKDKDVVHAPNPLIVQAAADLVTTKARS